MFGSLKWIALAVLLSACEPPTQNSQAGPSSPASSPAPAETGGSSGPKSGWVKSSTNAQIQVDSVLTRKNFYIVLDGSPSMTESKCAGRENKIVVAKRAIKQFTKLVPEDDNIAFMAFDGRGITERVSLGTGNRDRLGKAIDETDTNSNGTPLYTAIRLAYDRLREQAGRQLGYGEYHLVIVTDGEANNEPGNAVDIINQLLSESPVVIHTIGFCMGEHHSLNQPGRMIYKDAANPQDLQEGLQDVLAEADKF